MKWEVRTMRSGTSFFDWTTFKKTVFRFWPLWGVYFVGWLFALPLNGLTMLRLDAQALSGIDYGYLENFAQYTVPESVTRDVMIVFLIFGVLAAMAVFSHLFSARSANLFGSLPIRREGLFLTHYLAGLSFLIVPNVIIFLLTLAVEAAGGCVMMKGLLFWLAAACGEGFFFYTLAVFCAMFTGHILALPAFYAIVNFFVMGVTGLVYIVLESFCYGFAGFPDGVGEAVQWFTPVERLYNAVRYERYVTQTDLLSSVHQWGLREEGLFEVGIYAIAALILAVCAFLLYRRRRLESAGDVVAVNAMKPVFKYGVALCVGLAFGLGTMVILYGGEIGLMIAIVIWGVIGYFAAEMLLQKSFKVFRKWKGALAVTAVFIILFCVVGFDLTGYETRIPDPADVESVSVRGLEVLYLNDSGDRLDLTVTDPEQIRLITLLHSAAVDQRDADWDALVSGGGTTTSLYVTYHLKNGGALSRQYHNVWVRPAETETTGTAAWAVQQFYSNRALCWRMYGFDELENYLAQGGRLTSAEYIAYDKDSGTRTDDIYYGADAEVLFAAMKEDFFAGRAGVRRVTGDKWGETWYRTDETLYFQTDYVNNGYYNVRIALSDTASSTRAVLEDLARAAADPGPPDPDHPDTVME